MKLYKPVPVALHKSREDYFCGCVACEDRRMDVVRVGSLVIPATQDPERTSPGTVSVWKEGTWKETGWGLRVEDHLAGDPWYEPGTPGEVIKIIPQSDKDCGHLYPCLVKWPAIGEYVTSMRWLVVVEPQ